MLQTAEKIREIGGLDARALPAGLLESTEPLVLRGLVIALAHGARRARVVAGGEPLPARLLSRCHGGRDARRAGYRWALLLQRRFLRLQLHDRQAAPRCGARRNRAARVAALHPRSIYVGSTTIDTALPGFREHNDIDLGARNALASIWIGNQARIAAHHDLPDNLACVAVGHRRFTLFPPEQLANLYVGPLDLTPAGQAISLVDFATPDLARFPRFAQAAQAARVAELAPGDAIFIPSMWWHHVESLDSFNVLVNYWWRQSPAYMDAPIGALMMAIMTMRDLPPAQRAAWQNLFRHYVFEADAKTIAHIPEHSRGSLGTLTGDVVRDIRARLIARLNR